VSRSATITVAGGGITRTVSIAQAAAAQDVVVDPVPPANGAQSYLVLRLGIPTDDPFSGTFLVVLPPGMSLDLTKTVILGSLANQYDLLISKIDAQTWLIEIRPKSSPRTLSTTAAQDIVKIAYTVSSSVADGSYEISIRDLEFTVGDHVTIRKDEIRVPVTVAGPTGNEAVEAGTEVWYSGGVLSVGTPLREVVTVYSLSGSPVFSAEKAAGRATFRLPHLPGGVYIVRGGSGWARKIFLRQE
jgi:hypothetical protein